MKTPASFSSDEQLGPFQFVILVLSVVSLGVIAADAFLTLPREVSRLLQGVDLIVCLALMVDFGVRFRVAESKIGFLKTSWLDLLASVPIVDVLRAGRVVRVLRVLRLLRGIWSLQRLLRVMFRSKARGGAASVVMTTFLLVVFSSVAILLCENGPEANITTAGDAVWWSVTTITTVGYGDRYPTTVEGRALAMTLMLAGVGLFGALSALITSVFIGRSEADGEALAEIRALRAELAELRAGRRGE